MAGSAMPWGRVCDEVNIRSFFPTFRSGPNQIQHESFHLWDFPGEMSPNRPTESETLTHTRTHLRTTQTFEKRAEKNNIQLFRLLFFDPIFFNGKIFSLCMGGCVCVYVCVCVSAFVRQAICIAARMGFKVRIFNVGRLSKRNFSQRKPPEKYE